MSERYEVDGCSLSDVSANVIERFWSKTIPEPNSGCWLWTAHCNAKGYGVLRVRDRTWLAHRFAMTLSLGISIPYGQCVLHRCDNPPCCNPGHLFLGTNQDNVHDRESKGRGRPLRGENHPSRTKPWTRPRGDNHYSRTSPEYLARGEKNGRARLTEQTVAEIRASCGSLREIASRFAISKTQAWEIRSGKAWAHSKDGTR